MSRTLVADVDGRGCVAVSEMYVRHDAGGIDESATRAQGVSGIDNQTSLAQPLLARGYMLRNRYKVDTMWPGDVSGFGQIWLAKDVLTKRDVVVKVEPVEATLKVLETEVYAISSIAKQLAHRRLAESQWHILPTWADGHVRGAGAPSAPVAFALFPRVGVDLSALQARMYGKRFTRATTLMLAAMEIECIRQVHECGWLHRDIKPGNFCLSSRQLGDTSAPTQLYIIDFGLASTYRQPDGSHRERRANAGWHGTVRYASLNTHRWQDTSRRDDLSSVLYMAMEHAVGQDRLPWDTGCSVPADFDPRADRHYRDAVARVKAASTVPLLGDMQSPALSAIHGHVASLQFDDMPDYNYMLRCIDGELSPLGRVTPDWQLPGYVTAPLE